MQLQIRMTMDFMKSKKYKDNCLISFYALYFHLKYGLNDGYYELLSLI